MQCNGISVESGNAEKLRLELVAAGLINKKFKIKRAGEKIIFPIEGINEKERKALLENFEKIEIRKFDFEGQDAKPRNLREALKGKLTHSQMNSLKTAFDTLGDIAILEIPPELKRKEKIIGQALLLVNKSIKVVCKKTGAHKGKFRAEPIKIIAGERRKTATYREGGCTFRISLGKVFFSPRLATERRRIAGLIQDGETVAALFAGVGPFPIVFAKNSGMKLAYAVELNPAAVEDMEYNIRLNRVGEKVISVLGDVNKIAPKLLKGKCDRAVMPLPKGGETFLESAIMCIKESGGIVHFYQFSPQSDPFTEPIGKIIAACARAGRECRVISKKKVRSYSPGTIQVVIDFEVE